MKYCARLVASLKTEVEEGEGEALEGEQLVGPQSMLNSKLNDTNYCGGGGGGGGCDNGDILWM